MLPALLAVVVAVASPAVARADHPDVARARAAIRDGDPERAIEILERAQESSTDPEIERELFLAYQQLRDDERAAEHLQAFLDAESELDEEERAELESILRDLRAPPDGTPARGDDVLRIAGWAQLGAGIGGLITFLIGGTLAATFENNLPEDCRNEERLCAPGARDPVRDAWTVATVGIGPGIILLVLGAVDLALAEGTERGASRSLPPDLDPGVSSPRTFSLAPWADPSGAGVTGAIAF